MRCQSVVVVDVGREFTKAGLSGDVVPELYGVTVPDVFDLVVDVVCRLVPRWAMPCPLLLSSNMLGKKLVESLLESEEVSGLMCFDPAILDVVSHSKRSGIVTNYGGMTDISVVLNGHIKKKISLPGGAELTALIEDHFGCCREEADVIKRGVLDLSETEYRYRGKTVNAELINKSVVQMCVTADQLHDVIEQSHCNSVGNSQVFVTGNGWRIAGTDSKVRERLKGFRNRLTFDGFHHTFLGGSILGSIGKTQELAVGKEEYEETGLAAVDRALKLVHTEE